MCGIVGITSSKSVSTSILNSLRKLEYRGYDSAGIATLNNGLINEIKCEGRVDVLEKNISKEDAQSSIFAYGVGVDLTRRDIQMDARQKGRPWDMAKGFDQSALVGTLSLSKDCNSIENSKIWLKVNGVLKQYSEINKMIWSSAEIISFLSEYVQLMPGDLIFTGTPEGVGSLKKGDLIEGGISGLNEIKFMLDN